MKINGVSNSGNRPAGRKHLSEDFFPSGTNFVAIKGSGALSSYAMPILAIEFGNCTSLDPTDRSRFKNFGLIAIENAPTDKFGPGPHFVLVESIESIEEPKLENRIHGKSIHGAVGFIGHSRNDMSCESPEHIDRGNWLDIFFPRSKQLLRGKLLGQVYKARENDSYSMFYNRNGRRITIVPGPLKFRSPLIGRFTEAVEELLPKKSTAWISLVLSSVKKQERSIHFAELSDSSLTIPALDFHKLTEIAPENEPDLNSEENEME